MFIILYCRRNTCNYFGSQWTYPLLDPFTSLTTNSNVSKARAVTASRSAICVGWIMVPPYGSAQHDPPEIRCFYGHIPNFNMRRMDICYIYRRSRLARYFHDFIFSSNTSMDPWVSSIEPKQRQGSEIPKIYRISVLRNTCTSNLLLHPA